MTEQSERHPALMTQDEAYDTTHGAMKAGCLEYEEVLQFVADAGARKVVEWLDGRIHWPVKAACLEANGWIMLKREDWLALKRALGVEP